jgi:two-component system, NtrC family, sensor kinase
MRNLTLPILLFLFCINASAQKVEPFKIDSLPKQGILLDKGWKWQAGDNPEWAKADFDDSAWESIDPTKDIFDLPQLHKNPVNWLRLHFEVKNKLPHLLGLAINQVGASEIYLNGRLIHQIGHIDTDTKKIKAYDPLTFPIDFHADSVGQYQLAIRYALQPNIRYTEIFIQTKNRLFNATITHLLETLNAKRAFNHYYLGIEIFLSGILFMLLILHSVFYFYLRKNKTHLLIATYVCLELLVRFFKYVGESQFSVEYRYYYLNISNGLLAMIILCMAGVYYRLAKARLDSYYYFFIVFQLIYVFVSVFNYGFPWQSLLLLVGSIYSFVISIRLNRIGFKKKIKGFLVLSAAISVAILGLMTRTLAILFLNYGISPTGYNDLNYGISPYLIDFIINLGAIAIPVSLSIFMGIEANETTNALSKQLVENEGLKHLAIAQEQEKQQILSTQNDTLELQVKERTSELVATQNQLIQKEKLASLGELTAGIAHEIQNPLNFVNNFSDLSVGIAEDLKEELQRSDLDKKYIDELLTDLSTNQEKINHHGKRASSIVKGMLEHSRASTGERALTDINALCDEYLTLSYHGMRAKDKTFKADFKTDFDVNLPKINVLPQDLGRVLLNLTNNAFYAVHERNLQVLEDLAGFTPMVSISTKTLENFIEIKVKDNGNGIPKENLEKIFQPFFTTKPTGEGTGLGLSLSFDIITKGHGGTLNVKSEVDEGTTFIVKLAIN